MPKNFGIGRSGKTCGVLVVEDDFDSAEVLCVLIRQAGHDCQVALNAAEARAIIEDFTPDVALIDIGLPGESGYDLVQDLKRSLVGCRFIAMTGYGSSDMMTKSIEAGFEAHLTKPMSIQLLNTVLDGCTASAEGVAQPVS